jgi:hypothetical protein
MEKDYAFRPACVHESITRKLHCCYDLLDVIIFRTQSNIDRNVPSYMHVQSQKSIDRTEASRHFEAGT